MTHQSGQLTMQAPSRRSLTASDRTLVALVHLVWSLVARLGLSPHTTFAAMYLTVAVILAVIAVVCALKRCSHLLLNSPILAPVGAPRPSSKDLVLRTFSSVNYAQKHAHEQLSTPHGAAPPHCAALRRATLRRTAPHTTPWCAAPRHAAPCRATQRALPEGWSAWGGGHLRNAQVVVLLPWKTVGTELDGEQTLGLRNQNMELLESHGDQNVVGEVG